MACPLGAVDDGRTHAVRARAAIEIADPRKTYAIADCEIPALDGVSFRIEPGEFVSVLGPSGCGKTTVLRIVAGLTVKTSGSVEVDGVPVTGPQRKIGLVFQVPALMKWRTALENVLLPAEILGLDRAASRVRAQELLEAATRDPGRGGNGARRAHGRGKR